MIPTQPWNEGVATMTDDNSGWGSPGEQPREQQPPGYHQGPGRPAAAPKPGVIALRPLGVGEILDGAVGYIRANPVATLGLAAIVTIVTQVVQVATGYLLASNVDPTAVTPGSFEDVAGLVAAGGTALLVTIVITFVALTVLSGLLIVVLSRAVLGQSASLGEAWAIARPRLPGLLGLTLLTVLIVVAVFLVPAILAVVLLAVAGGAATVAFGVLMVIAAVALAVYVGILLVMATPIYMLESTGVGGALSRSRQLVRGSWWRIFGIVLLAGVITVVITAIIAIPFELLGGGALGGGDALGEPVSLAGLVLSAIGAIIAGTVTAPFSAGVTGLLYIDQRMRREGFDLELARSAGR